MQRTKATVRALDAPMAGDEAVELELAAQQWSVEQPFFAKALARVRARVRGAAPGGSSTGAETPGRPPGRED